jgi:hypothetical protein
MIAFSASCIIYETNIKGLFFILKFQGQNGHFRDIQFFKVFKAEKAVNIYQFREAYLLPWFILLLKATFRTVR